MTSRDLTQAASGVRDGDAFTLDTSGTITLAHPVYGGRYSWPDLSPFEQGYVEAVFASSPSLDLEFAARCIENPERHFRHIGFSDLAPETLAAIRKDCAEAGRDHLIVGNGRYEPEVMRQIGRQFWSERQRGFLGGETPQFPPLTVTLGDDGKVRLSAVRGTSERSDPLREEPSK